SPAFPSARDRTRDVSRHRIRFTLNGAAVEMDVPAERLLVDLLRDDLGKTGTKDGCSVGVCGLCAVQVEGAPMSACLLLATQVDGRRPAALATHGGLARPEAVRAHAPARASTFAAVATARIREQATVGGNLAHADPAQDPPVTLLALDGVAVAMSKARARRIPLEALFVDVFETSLEPDELLVRVELPPLPA